MTIAARQLREYIEATWPGTPISRFACRDTASGDISQHSAYKGYDSNALDVFGPGKTSGPADQAHIQAIVDTILADGISKWSIRKILWLQKDHYNHAHIDFYPMITMHKWCGGPETPTWRYSRGHVPATVTTRDPMPENGLYDGSGADPIMPPVHPPDPEEDEDMKEYLKAVQNSLNLAGFTDGDGNALVVDGVFGPKTEAAINKRDAAANSGVGGFTPHQHNTDGGTPI